MNNKGYKQKEETEWGFDDYINCYEDNVKYDHDKLFVELFKEEFDIVVTAMEFIDMLDFEPGESIFGNLGYIGGMGRIQIWMTQDNDESFPVIVYHEYNELANVKIYCRNMKCISRYCDPQSVKDVYNKMFMDKEFYRTHKTSCVDEENRKQMGRLYFK